MHMQPPLVVEFAEQMLAVRGRFSQDRLVDHGCCFSEPTLRTGGGHDATGEGFVQTSSEPVQGVALWHNRSISISERTGLSGLGCQHDRGVATWSSYSRDARRATRPIAALLMDQTILSGIGNVYRAEVLFRNRVNPHRPGSRLSRRSWQGIWSDLVELMPIGVRDGRIDTVRPEHTPEAMHRPPRQDIRGGEVYVYRRTGQPCLVCGSTIRTEVLAGRNLFWCGKCQRRG